MNNMIMIVGTGKTGTVLAKEVARLLNARSGNDFCGLCLLDGGNVKRSDLKEGLYLEEDLGESKSATLQMVLENTFSRIKVQAYEKLPKNGHFPAAGNSINKRFGLMCSHSQVHWIVCDCSGGKADESILNFWRKRVGAEVTIMSPQKEGLYIKHSGKGNKRIRKLSDLGGYDTSWTTSDKLRNAYLMFGQICKILDECDVSQSVRWSATNTYRTNAKTETFQAAIPLDFDKMDVICVGAGGTGGDFIKEFVPFLLRSKKVSLTIVDGDKVEDKNLARQAFGKGDIQQNKAQILMEHIVKQYPHLEKRVHCITKYIDTIEDMKEIPHKGFPVLVGAVDNHRARQVFVQWFETLSDGLWIDSANEFSYGEVVVSIKKDGKNVSPLRSDIFPEVLTDRSLSASEQSCAVVNESSPQHQATNLTAAMLVIHSLEHLMENGVITGGIDYFDALDDEMVFSEFRPLYVKGAIV